MGGDSCVPDKMENVADGTRLVCLRFDGALKCLPYSNEFKTAAGPHFFHVIHNYQTRVCCLCCEKDHLKDCPKFCCFRCGEQGHYAKEYQHRVSKCKIYHNKMGECICLASEDKNVKETDYVYDNVSVIANGKLNADENLPEPIEVLLLDFENDVIYMWRWSKAQS